MDDVSVINIPSRQSGIKNMWAALSNLVLLHTGCRSDSGWGMPVLQVLVSPTETTPEVGIVTAKME